MLGAKYGAVRNGARVQAHRSNGQRRKARAQQPRRRHRRHDNRSPFQQRAQDCAQQWVHPKDGVQRREYDRPARLPVGVRVARIVGVVPVSNQRRRMLVVLGEVRNRRNVMDRHPRQSQRQAHRQQHEQLRGKSKPHALPAGQHAVLDPDVDERR